MTTSGDNLQEWRAYTRAALEIIDENVRLYRRGKTACYRAVAAQLRLLLCDTTRQHGEIVDISLARRIKPELALPPLRLSPPDLPDGGLSFDRQATLLPLAAWLNQRLPLSGGCPPLSLRDLIRLVADQDGGAHVDPKPHSLIRHRPTRAAEIIAIGEMILDHRHSMIGGSEPGQ